MGNLYHDNTYIYSFHVNIWIRLDLRMLDFDSYLGAIFEWSFVNLCQGCCANGFWWKVFKNIFNLAKIIEKSLHNK